MRRMWQENSDCETQKAVKIVNNQKALKNFMSQIKLALLIKSIL